MGAENEAGLDYRVGRGIKVLEDRVLIRRDKPVEMSKGGIIIPDQSKDVPDEGRVVAVGPGLPCPQLVELLDAEELDQFPGRMPLYPMHVKAGDKVVFSRYGGSTISHEGEQLVILRQPDVLAVVEDAPSGIVDVDVDEPLVGDFEAPDAEAPLLA